MFRLITVRYFLTFLLLLNNFAAPKLFADVGAEKKAFNAAVKLLEPLKQFKLAEESFAKFVQEFPESEHKPWAILHQAQACFYQTNYIGASELLQLHFAQSGILAHEYQYWIGQTFFHSGNYRAAADAWALFIKTFSDSPYYLEVCYSQALAESKLKNWPRVIELLQTPGGNFEAAAKTQPNNGFVVDGNLLLAESLFELSRFVEAEKVGVALEGRTLIPNAKWRQHFLLCRIQLAAGQFEKALGTTTNLATAAKEAGGREKYAESILLRAEILEKLNNLSAAIGAYEQNLAEGTPPNIRRQSFFKIVDLNLVQGATTNAMLRLEKFIEQNPADASVDLARITLGELRLKQFVLAMPSTNAPGKSNLFEQAFTNFNIVITHFPQSAHLGKAYLNRGWCFWIQENIPAAGSDFFEATERLPISEDKAVARFKLADVQFRQTNYAAAMTNYQLLIENFGALERITNSLFEPALYQGMRASLKAGNDAAATNAMYKLLDWFPNGSLADRSLLLVGENLNRVGKEPEARELYLDFLKRFPDSPRVAEIKLAVAESFVREKKWDAALAEFDNWVTNFTAHPLLPQGEFSRALAFDKADKKTNAFNLFTNFVVRFPTNHLAALAQNWIADFYWNRGDFHNAEKAYQELYQKFNPPAEIAYQARLMAGRAAYDRLDYKGATEYFTDLVNRFSGDTNAVNGIADEALFALGDTLFQEFLSNPNTDIGQAINAFSRIKSSTNILGVLATGRVGDCYFQWAGQDAAQAQARYDKALEYYGTVIESNVADISARSRAEVGVGNVCLKMAGIKPDSQKRAWVDAALKRYMNVVSQSNLHEGESFDAKWIYEAGIAAGKICESSEQWEQAKNIYLELAKLLPPLRLALEKKIATAQTHLETAKN
ncbi:MAG: tetratricopeptide repeat protein [Verrucomicrobiota bacterium]